jgi:wyosine [tRNA(Phe)-imidazoG37] synthetase (radical SAM superfamily)
VDGLVAFREEYQGKLWVEVMLVRGLNDSTQALEAIAQTLRRIRPDAVHINLPSRPPAETWVQPPTDEGLMQALAILGNIAEVVHPAEGSFDLSGYNNPILAAIAIITRRPMRQEELERTLNRWTPGKVSEALVELRNSKRAQVVERYGVRFWSALSSHYPDEADSSLTDPQHKRRQEKQQLA